MSWKRLILNIIVVTLFGSVIAWAGQATFQPTVLSTVPAQKVVPFSTGDCCDE